MKVTIESKTTITVEDQVSPYTFGDVSSSLDVQKLLESNKSSYLVELLQEHLSEADAISKEVNQYHEESAWASARNFWKSHWSDVKWCLDNNKLLYLFAYVQSRKTVYYNALIELILNGFTTNDGTNEKSLADVVWMSTNNMLASHDQNLARAQDTLPRHGISVISSNDAPKGKVQAFRFMEKEMYVAIHNPSRMTILRRSLNYTEKVRREECEGMGKEYSPLRVLVILDEGDEVNVEMADSNNADLKDSTATERELFAIRSEHNVRIMSVSATTTSLLIVYSNFFKNVGPLEYRQIFRPPVSLYYKGVVVPHTGEYNNDFIRNGLHLEDKKVFNGGKYRATANIANTKNPMFIADSIIHHYEDKNSNPYELVQIATVTLGAQVKGHKRTAELIQRALMHIGKCKVQLIEHHLNNIKVDPTSEYIVVTHNGSSNSLDPAEKMKLIYDAYEFSNTKLKGIVFVGGYLLGRAVTYEIPGEWFKTNGKYFGAYCNLTFTYPSQSISAEAVIQTMRNSGVRPGYKSHVTYTTDDLKENIKEYYVLTEEFLDTLENEGELDDEHVLNYGLSCSLTKQRVEKYTGKSHSSESRHVKYNSMGNPKRAELINNGFHINGILNRVVPVDCYIELTNDEYMKLSSMLDENTKARCEYSKKLMDFHGFTWVEFDENSRVRHLASKKDKNKPSSWLQRTNHSFTFWKSNTGRTYLYYWDGKSNHKNDWIVHYVLDTDGDNLLFDIDRPKQKSYLERPINSGATITVGGK